jgi:hypothetical protein
MRFSCALASGTCLTILLVTGLARGQAKPPAQSSSQFTLRREAPAGADAQTARARARAGDCAGALPAFDVAVRATIDPTLRRDRGLCHDKLNHPHPAIEDYRAYLLLRPEATDGDQIRQRLAVLEEQVGIGGPSGPPKGTEGEGAGVNASGTSTSGGGSASASGSISLGGGSASSSSSGDKKSNVIGPRAGEAERSYDYYKNQEKLSDTAEESPLRRGSGAILGVILLPYRRVEMKPELTPDGAILNAFGFTGGSVPQVGYSIAGSLRYSTGPLLTLNAEIGYAGFGTVGAQAFGGLQSMLGVEFRVPISSFAADLIHFGFGVGFERYSIARTDLATNALLPRARIGYRHVFGPSFGLEAFADGGPAYFFSSVTDQFTAPFISVGLAFLIGGEGGT